MSENKIAVLSNVQARENSLIRNVYGYMAGGLAVTALVSYLTAQSAALMRFFNTSFFGLMLLMVAQLGLVIFLSSRIETMKRTTAIAAFFGYAAVTGFSFGSIFMVFDLGLIAQTFAITCLMFLGCSIYASVTKRNLRGWGQYLMMGLWGLLIVSVVSFFFHSTMMEILISVAGVVLFTGLAIWDTKRVVEMNRTYGSEMSIDEYTKLGILSALNLYLDFLNIFLYLLRIFAISSNRD